MPFHFMLYSSLRTIELVQSEKTTVQKITLGLSLIIEEVDLALINRSLTFMFGYSNLEVEEKTPPKISCNMKPSVLLKIFIIFSKTVQTKPIP